MATAATSPLAAAGVTFGARVRLWSVVTKSGQRQSLALNGCQAVIDYEIERARRAGIAALIKVIKLRQGGISTYGCARLQDAAQCLPDYACLSIADKLALPRIWLDRAEEWHAQTPGAPARERSNAQELVLANGSRYVIGSAEGTTPGMGSTLRALHCSEIGFWRRPAKIMGDLVPAVPLNDPSALILLESCGEMVGSWWHGEVLRTLEGDDAYTLVFLPWFLAPEYTADPAGLEPSAYTDEERALVAHAREWALGNPCHAGLAGFDGTLTPGQIAWRRWAIANLFSGDTEMFACRYPANISEAFMGIGSQAIPASITRHHQSTAREPIAVGRLEWADGGGVEWVDDPHGAWEVYEPGYEYCEYAIGGDVAEGRTSDPADERSERDWTTMGVLNRRTLSTTAAFRARIEADRFGEEMLKAGRFWNDAWLTPEANSAGMATLARVRDYGYLMPREGTPDQLDDRALDRLGWRTTPGNRDQLIDEWIAACNPNPSGDYEGRITCLCPWLADEERTFVRTATGKREHRPGCHDDTLFAFMIAIQVHRRCPHVRRSASPVSRRDILEAVAAGAVPDARYTGGVDSWALDLEEQAEDEGY